MYFIDSILSLLALFKPKYVEENSVEKGNLTSNDTQNGHSKSQTYKCIMYMYQLRVVHVVSNKLFHTKGAIVFSYIDA